MAKTPLSPSRSESEDQSSPSTSSSPAIGSQSSAVVMGAPPAGSYQMDADEEDENVKQLNECSAIYLPLQDRLVRTDRNWTACQPVGINIGSVTCKTKVGVCSGVKIFRLPYIYGFNSDNMLEFEHSS